MSYFLFFYLFAPRDCHVSLYCWSIVWRGSMAVVAWGRNSAVQSNALDKNASTTQRAQVKKTNLSALWTYSVAFFSSHCAHRAARTAILATAGCRPCRCVACTSTQPNFHFHMQYRSPLCRFIFYCCSTALLGLLKSNVCFYSRQCRTSVRPHCSDRAVYKCESSATI